jgi:ATP-dependent Zn protease
VQEDDLPTRQAIDDYVTVVLAGRAAERVLAGSMSAGAGGSHDSDLGIATSLVAAMHASSGLDDSLVCFGTRQDAVALIAIDGALKARVERHLQELQRRADELVERHREVVLEVARRLSSDRYVSGDVLRQIFERSRASHIGEHGAT